MLCKRMAMGAYTAELGTDQVHVPLVFIFSFFCVCEIERATLHTNF